MLALTVNNIIKALQDISFKVLCDILDIPGSKRQEIKQESESDHKLFVKAVKWWLLTDPLASWRRIVDRLYIRSYYEYLNLDVICDRIRHYTEELIGMYTYTVCHTSLRM